MEAIAARQDQSGSQRSVGHAATEIARLAAHARAASHTLRRSTSEQRDLAIRTAAEQLRADCADIVAANQHDVALALPHRSPAYIDRLRMDGDGVHGLADALIAIAAQPDPLHRILAELRPVNGLIIEKCSVPIGVIGIIFESRPNVGGDAGALCIKSGNAVILRPGSDAMASVTAIVTCLHAGLRVAGLPIEAVQITPDGDRALVGAMLGATGLIDVMIPRGGKSLIERVLRESRTPVLAHLEGNNHTYIHSSADTEMAVKIVENAKMRRTSVCGAMETLLVDEQIAAHVIPIIAAVLCEQGCEIRGCPRCCTILSLAIPATDADWCTEYMAPILAIRVVEGIDAAISHIQRYGSTHTEAIIAEDDDVVAQFFAEIDSAIVMHNASTQFADGGEFGMGAEIGISTGRLHARGPIGANELTSMRFLVRGGGRTRPRY